MDLPKYEDVHPAYTASGYVATNEEPRIHSMLLAPHHHIERAASIASGGEIPLMVLMARCREVVAVDHSYFALASTMLKAILLQTLGARKLVEVMVEQSFNDFKPHMENAKNHSTPASWTLPLACSKDGVECPATTRLGSVSRRPSTSTWRARRWAFQKSRLPHR